MKIVNDDLDQATVVESTEIVAGCRWPFILTTSFVFTNAAMVD